MKSKENVDVYSTNEPQAAFHQRTSFCLGMYNESVKALRFPHSDHKKQLDALLEAENQEKELLDLNDYDDDMDF
jgi:26S proteasome regulatory subunit N3